jgi:hypothetical protein
MTKVSFHLAHVLECGSCVANVGDALDCNGECDKHIKTATGECQWRTPKSIIQSVYYDTSTNNTSNQSRSDEGIAKECDGNINKYVCFLLLICYQHH